jgi:hypothetical protein
VIRSKVAMISPGQCWLTNIKFFEPLPKGGGFFICRNIEEYEELKTRESDKEWKRNGQPIYINILQLML